MVMLSQLNLSGPQFPYLQNGDKNSVLIHRIVVRINEFNIYNVLKIIPDT